MSSFSFSSGYETITDSSHQFLLSYNQEETVPCYLYGYKSSSSKSIFYYIFNLILLGIPSMLFSWNPSWKVLRYTKCSLRDCKLIYIKDSYSRSTIVKVFNQRVDLPNRCDINLRYFIYQHNKYVWIASEEKFGSLDYLLPFTSIDSYLNDRKPLSDLERNNLRNIYGENEIRVEIKSYGKLFKEEIFSPFYIFQAFSIVLWFCDDYMIYAACILFLTFGSIISSLLETRRQSKAMHDLVESSKCRTVSVIRQFLTDEYVTELDPSDLMPGDLIIIPPSNYIMPCDALLLTGLCIVNESMLTGESVPVTKTSPHPNSELYSPSDHKRHTLFSGTLVIQTRYHGGEHVIARVVRTGFTTTKGALVKSILYPTPITNKYQKDSMKFIFVLFIAAFFGTAYCIYLFWSRKASLKAILIRSFDIVTIVVPPALPAAITVGVIYSQSRLKKLGIFSISPQRIIISGKINLACFDKTGTLTNDGLDMHSVITCKAAVFEEPASNVYALSPKSRLVQAMACCHSLTQINGVLNGDPLDLNMFNFTEWELEEPGNAENSRFDMLAPTVVRPRNSGTGLDFGLGDAVDAVLPYEIGIIREFPFSSTLQSMSVICRLLSSPNLLVFTKGAPEKVVGMCDADSIPRNFSARLSEYTSKGYRVIAVGYKELPSNVRWKNAQQIKRDVVECDLKFLGLLIMQNTLKPETTPIIKNLQKANIRTVMITGDNVLTAVSVARECSMIQPQEKVILLQVEEDVDGSTVIPRIMYQHVGTTDCQHVAIDLSLNDYHFAIDGKTWNILNMYYSDWLQSFIVKTTVFARFQPDQKTQLIRICQNMDYVVSMVGDGANDCGALKAAHVGISLSQAEASVAAPFTSSIQNISCLDHLILEGRCALVTSFAVFKYMAMYSIIQFFTILILYRDHSILGDTQFLFIDLIITTSLALTIGLQGPSRKLSPKRPLGSLVSLKNLIPLFLQIIVCGLIQVGSVYFLIHQVWYKPLESSTKGETVLCWENTVLFTVSCFQYVIIAVVYSKGKPYRESIFESFWFLCNVLILVLFTTWIMIYPEKHVAEFFQVVHVERSETDKLIFRYELLLFPLVHFIIAVFIEACICDTKWLKCLIRFVIRKKTPKNKYKLICNDNEYQYWLSPASV